MTENEKNLTEELGWADTRIRELEEEAQSLAEHDSAVRRKAIEEVASYWDKFPSGEIDGQFVAEWTRQNFK